MRKSPRLTTTAACALQVLAALPASAAPAPSIPLPPIPAPIPVPRAPLFTDAERARVLAFWGAPGRYQAAPRANFEREGAFVARLTPEASLWFRAYNNVLRPGKMPPTVAAPESSDVRAARWEAWVAAKVARDRWAAQQSADRANGKLPPIVAEPPLPGAMPADLLAAVGNAPPFAAPVAPVRHVVTFADGQVLAYEDHIRISSPRYAYYRFDSGVSSEGVALRDWPARELDDFFSRSGLGRSEANVMRAVSKLEGGFDSINTYDTGFVSVGFIQFASLEEGAGSLGPVLLQEKRTRPADFERDFRAFGLDVDFDSTLVALDLGTGAELRGPDANAAIIADKRLIAVFQRAGKGSVAFRSAQVAEAKRRFYPADKEVAVALDGQILRGRVSDIIRSEAGMATLLDRSVNVGNIRLLNDEAARLMRERRLSRLAQLVPFERELVARLKWRADFLRDATLSQPR